MSPLPSSVKEALSLLLIMLPPGYALCELGMTRGFYYVSQFVSQTT